jgi:FMN phosphatase YigB (HAD superfamily)
MTQDLKKTSSAQPFSQNLSEVSHLLVDLDGTLVGAKDLSLAFEFLKRTLPVIKKQGTWLDTLRAVRSMRDVLDQPNPDNTNHKRSTQAFARVMGLPFEKADQLLTQLLSEQFPELEKHFYPIPGAEDFLNWARDHYPLVLATNPVWKEEIVRLRIRWAKIDPSLFSWITHSERMHACKPTSEYYLEILQQSQLKHSQCLLIGNDPKMDLPAVLVGIPVFIVANIKKMEPIRLKGQKAPAWTGGFKHLKQLLMS